MLKKGKGYKSRLAGQARIVRANFVSALPVICFFLFLFYTVILIFGAQYTMVVSLATLLFQTNYRQRKSWDSLVHMALVQLAISVAAYLATLSFPLSVGLNLVLPFGLVFLRTSRFNKMGYFSGLMTFTFLQLIPLDFRGFLIQTGAFVYSLIWFFVLVKLYQKMYPARSDYSRQQEGLRLLADCLRQQLDGQEKSPEMLRDIYRLQQLQYQETYAKRGSRQIATREGKIAYMFALLFQRASYFISCRFEPSMLEDSGTRELLERTAACLAQAAQARFWEREARAALREEGEGILEMAEASEDELHHSVSSFLIPFLIILRKFDERDADEQGAEWLMPRHQRPLGKLRFQMKPDGFEMRFALRMSAVLTLSFLFVHVSGADRAYWLPLNAFLLLRPMYEDSRYRMLTRFIGTAAGCVIMSALLPFLGGVEGHFLMAGLMAACMYTAMPGTCVHASFVTCFALSVVTLAMQEETAVELRMIYVMAAVVLVLVINRFFFPTSAGQQFRFNLSEVLRMHHLYLQMLEEALDVQTDYGTICDAQTEYHLIHGQVMEYLGKRSGPPWEMYRQLMGISWDMVSEIEQILLFVNSGHLGESGRREMENYTAHARYVLAQIQDVLGFKGEKNLPPAERITYRRGAEGEMELSYFLTAYAKNLSKMYRIVLENKEQ